MCLSSDCKWKIIIRNNCEICETFALPLSAQYPIVIVSVNCTFFLHTLVMN